MTFFARPNLDSDQFKQIPDTVLTLSGQTRIANITGLTLYDNVNDIFIPIVVSDATNLSVLTYSDITSQITLQPVSGNSGGVYSGASPTSCTVGGLASGTAIANCSITSILESILVPTLSPTLTSNSLSMTLAPTTTLFEVGCSISFTASMSYSRGSVAPVYCSGTTVRTGAATCYVFTDISGATYSGVSNICAIPSKTIMLDNNTISGTTSYSTGIAPTKSNGDSMIGVTCSASTISTSNVVSGILPYFWGSSVSAPILASDACAQCLITGGTKCVGVNTGDVLVTNYNVIGQYIWVAIPATSTTKTKWQGCNSPSNCGTIPGDLMASECIRNIYSPSSCWSSESYKIYVSNYGTSINYCMLFKNS